jgi:predicted TPR repeat methyltransferase
MPTRRPSISPTLRIALIEDGMIAHDVASDALHHLNPMAAALLTLSDGHHELEEITAAVLHGVAPAGCAGIDATALTDWFEVAAQTGLVVCDTPARSGLQEMDGDELVRLAERLRTDGEIDKAYLCQRRATELAPAMTEWWYDLGTLAQAVGDVPGACTAYARYLELTPDDAETAHLLHALGGAPPPARASDAYVVQYFKKFSSNFDRILCKRLNYRAPAALREALSALLLSKRPKLKTLDLGCGTGLAGVVFRPWARWLEGVDLSPDMAARARARGTYNAVHVAELTAWLSTARRTYELIISCDVLIYFGDLTDVFEAAARRLVPGGWLGFTVERSTVEPWQLTVSGRYAHGADYLRTAAEAAGLEVMHLAENVIRMEYGEPVVGLITILRRPRQGEPRSGAEIALNPATA